MPADTMYGIPGKAETLLSKLIPNSIFLTSTRSPDNSRSKTGSLILSTSKRRVVNDRTKPIWLLFILVLNLPSAHAMFSRCFKGCKEPEPIRKAHRPSRRIRRISRTEAEGASLVGLSEDIVYDRLVADGNMALEDTGREMLDIMKKLDANVAHSLEGLPSLSENDNKASSADGDEAQATFSLADLTRQRQQKYENEKKYIEKLVIKARKDLEEAGNFESILDTCVTAGWGRKWLGDIVKRFLNELAGVKGVPDDFTCVAIDLARFLGKLAPVVFAEFFANFNKVSKLDIKVDEIISKMDEQHVKALEKVRNLAEDFIKILKVFHKKQFSHPFGESDIVRYQNRTGDKLPKHDEVHKNDRQGVYWVEEITDDYQWIMLKTVKILEDGKIEVAKKPRELPTNESRTFKKWQGTIWESCRGYFGDATKKARFPATLVFEPVNMGCVCEEAKGCTKAIQARSDVKNASKHVQNAAMVLKHALGKRDDKASVFLTKMLSDDGNNSMLSILLNGISMIDLDKDTDPRLQKAKQMLEVAKILVSNEHTAKKLIQVAQSRSMTEFALAPHVATALTALAKLFPNDEVHPGGSSDTSTELSGMRSSRTSETYDIMHTATGTSESDGSDGHAEQDAHSQERNRFRATAKTADESSDSIFVSNNSDQDDTLVLE